MNVSVRPWDFPGKKPSSADLRTAFRSALNTNLAPSAPPPTGRAPAVSLYLTARDLGQIEAFRGTKCPGLTVADAIGGLAAAHWQQKAQQPAAACGTPPVPPANRADTDRSISQSRMLTELESARTTGKIVLIEGGTGVGKSRVMGRAAIAAWQAGQRTLLVAPTLATMLHLAEELRQCDPDAPAFIVPGKGNFVNGDRLLAYLDDLEAEETDLSEAVLARHQRVREWLAEGAKPISDSAQRLQLILGNVSHLIEDALTLAPHLNKLSIRVEDVLEDSDWGDLILGLREGAQTQPIVITTHAMLAAHLRITRTERGTPILGQWDLLLVDEAHELENSIASSLSDFISIRATMRLLQNTPWTKIRLGKAAQNALDWLNRLHTTLASQTASHRRQDVIADPSLFAGAANAFDPMTKTKASGQSLAIQLAEVRRVAGIFRVAEQGNLPAGVNFSAIRKYPRVTVGPRSVRRELETLWELSPAVGLLSATLLLPSSSGDLSPNYMHEKLALIARPTAPGRPPRNDKDFRHRLAPSCVVTPSWIIQTPTVHLPARECAHSLSYPQLRDVSEDETDTQVFAWHKSIADVLQSEVLPNAVGGTLVLANSYADIEAIASYLRDHRRLIVAARTKPFVLLKDEFIRHHRAGAKPVLLALGPAWTGFDLRDPDAASAEDDNLLTDLVILRIPFNSVDNSVTQQRKRERGPTADHQEALLRLRQGLGRLVRRPGLKDRHIWFLDGRIYTRQRMGAFRKLMERYPNRREFKV